MDKLQMGSRKNKRGRVRIFSVSNLLEAKIIFLLIFFSLSFVSCMQGNTFHRKEEFSRGGRNNRKITSWAYQLQNIDINRILSSSFSLIVIDYSEDGTEEREFSSRDIARIKSRGIIPVAYISIGEAEDYRFYWKEEWKENPPDWIRDENPEWKGNYAVEYWNENWRKVIFSYIDKVLKQGFEGIYLDKVDEFLYWSEKSGGGKEYYARKMIDFIVDISSYVRRKAGESFLVIPQNGEIILSFDTEKKLFGIVSGWGAEDLFYNGTQKWSEEDSSWIKANRIKFLDMLVENGKFVLSVDYVDDGTGYIGENKNRIDDYIVHARERGYIPYVALSDRELDEINIIPDIQPFTSFSSYSPFSFLNKKIDYSLNYSYVKLERISAR